MALDHLVGHLLRVAGVSATESPSQLNPELIQRRCTTGFFCSAGMLGPPTHQGVLEGSVGKATSSARHENDPCAQPDVHHAEQRIQAEGDPAEVLRSGA